MKRLASLAMILAGLAAAEGAEPAKAATNSRAVLAPVRRIEALKQADQVLAPRTPTWKTATAEMPDPFFRSNVDRVAQAAKPEVVPEPARAERSDLEVLETAAATLNPTGTMMVDGENYLLLGGRRYKIGQSLSITLDGIAYSVVISAIEGKSYTLRLNEQELRRQLK